MSTKNLRLAVAPHDHVRFSDSVVGLAGKIRGMILEPKSLDELKYLLDRSDSGWPGQVDFEKITLAVFCYMQLAPQSSSENDRVAGIR